MKSFARWLLRRLLVSKQQQSPPRLNDHRAKLKLETLEDRNLPGSIITYTDWLAPLTWMTSVGTSAPLSQSGSVGSATPLNFFQASPLIPPPVPSTPPPEGEISGQPISPPVLDLGTAPVPEIPFPDGLPPPRADVGLLRDFGDLGCLDINRFHSGKAALLDP